MAFFPDGEISIVLYSPKNLVLWVNSLILIFRKDVKEESIPGTLKSLLMYVTKFP